MVDLVRMRTRVPGSKKLPGAIFNVRLLHGPVGVSPMDGTNNPAIRITRIFLIHPHGLQSLIENKTYNLFRIRQL